MRRVYVTAERRDGPSAERVVEEPQLWCVSCVSQYPNDPVDDVDD